MKTKLNVWGDLIREKQKNLVRYCSQIVSPVSVFLFYFKEILTGFPGKYKLCIMLINKSIIKEKATAFIKTGE